MRAATRDLLKVARAAEDAGFESVRVGDRVAAPATASSSTASVSWVVRLTRRDDDGDGLLRFVENVGRALVSP